MASLLERYKNDLIGMISCYDRILLQGAIPEISYVAGMARLLQEREIPLARYAEFVMTLRDLIRDNAERLAADHGLTIEFVRKASTRKEDLVAQVLDRRGHQPGLVHILSAMENCQSYEPRFNKQTDRSYLKAKGGKCLHYYFYFIDPELGLCHLRVPTWCPYRLQFCLNGHNILAAQLTAQGIPFRQLDNAFLAIGDFDAAQSLANDYDIARLHARLDAYAHCFCPVAQTLQRTHHWSIMQAEYATDIIFKDPATLHAVYDAISRTAVLAVKPDHVAHFLGRPLAPHYRDELGTTFDTRIEGTCIRHRMGPATLKMYDKFGFILRIETTTNDVSFFKHHRQVEQKDGRVVGKIAPVKKTIYALPALAPILLAANLRYLDFISQLDDPSDGQKKLHRTTQSVTQKGHSYRGFNFFAAEDQHLFQVIARGEFLINGLRNKSLRRYLVGLSPAQISRRLKNLRLHGLIRKAAKSYKYYLTAFGRQIVVAGLKLKELFLVPELSIIQV